MIRSRSFLRSLFGAALSLSLAAAPLATVTLGAGCGATASSIGGGVRRGGATDPSAYQAAITAGDAAFALRADRAQLEAAIAKYEEAIALKDDDYETYEKLARANYLLADGWLFFEQADKKELFLKPPTRRASSTPSAASRLATRPSRSA
jgi:hypothetical protein